jgi:hypothetical protein
MARAGGDHERGRDRYADQDGEVRIALKARDGGEPLAERDREEKREQHLYAGDRDPQLLEELAELPVEARLLVVLGHGATLPSQLVLPGFPVSSSGT